MKQKIKKETERYCQDKPNCRVNEGQSYGVAYACMYAVINASDLNKKY